MEPKHIPGIAQRLLKPSAGNNVSGELMHWASNCDGQYQCNVNPNVTYNLATCNVLFILYHAWWVPLLQICKRKSRNHVSANFNPLSCLQFKLLKTKADGKVFSFLLATCHLSPMNWRMATLPHSKGSEILHLTYTHIM